MSMDHRGRCVHTTNSITHKTCYDAHHPGEPTLAALTSVPWWWNPLGLFGLAVSTGLTLLVASATS